MKNIDNIPTKAIEIINVGKMYELFSSPLRRVLNAFGLDNLLFFESHKRRQLFWALRGVTLNILKGSRVGIIGNNGAGKSTLLKIITGNVSPTEGTVQIDGRIQALMELGTGFHPEFTGRQNIYASLAYQGISKEKILELEQDIIDFSELEKFIDQPVKTYSSGMFVRLAFAIASHADPDILVVDEIGAGVGLVTPLVAFRIIRAQLFVEMLGYRSQEQRVFRHVRLGRGHGDGEGVIIELGDVGVFVAVMIVREWRLNVLGQIEEKGKQGIVGGDGFVVGPRGRGVDAD